MSLSSPRGQGVLVCPCLGAPHPFPGAHTHTRLPTCTAPAFSSGGCQVSVTQQLARRPHPALLSTGSLAQLLGLMGPTVGQKQGCSGSGPGTA